MDEQLVALLNMRAICAIEIGRIKRREAIPVYQPEREAEVGRHVRAVNTRLGGPLSGESIGRLFERIIDEARQLEASADGDSGGPAPDAGAGHSEGGQAGRPADGATGGEV